jgi:dynein heavy chain
MQHRFVFFDMAVQHITRAARVFRNPGSHMMMVGVGGTGKATVARLAAYIEGCHFMMPIVSRVYQWPEFCDDLKRAIKKAGLKGENTVLFLTDAVVNVSKLD